MGRRIPKGWFVAGIGAGLALIPILRARRRRFGFSGRAVLVTGGSRGLGLVLCRQLVAAGARVAITARDAEALERAQRDLAAFGGEVLTVPCDLSDPEQLATMVRTVRRNLGPIEMLVNNAGIIQVGPLDTMRMSDFEAAMAVHVWAPLRLVQAVLPDMRKRGEGRIVNISSFGGKFAVPHLAPYVTSKFALTGLSESLTVSLAKENIRVVTVCPGLMRTGSPWNALFKGRHRAEYRWFAIGSNLPVVSVDAERAARRILAAADRGIPEVMVTGTARLASAVWNAFPNLGLGTMALVDRLLPGDGGLGKRSVSGFDSRGGLTASFATRGTDRAASRFNEAPGR
jgi:NAD(P)-dependent dehydrogenase (short-subunit alcohol dehydrogenase family)